MRFKWCSDRDVPKYQFEEAFHQPIRMKQGRATVACRYNAHEVSSQTLEHFKSSKCLGSVTLTYKGFELSESDIYPLFDMTSIHVKSKSSYLEHITEQSYHTTQDWDETEPDIYPTDVENVCESSDTLHDSSRCMQSSDLVESPPSELCDSIHQEQDGKVLHVVQPHTQCIAVDSLDSVLKPSPRVCAQEETTCDNFSCLATLAQERGTGESVKEDDDKEIGCLRELSYGTNLNKDIAQLELDEISKEPKDDHNLLTNNTPGEINNLQYIQGADSAMLDESHPGSSTNGSTESPALIKCSKGPRVSPPIETYLFIAPDVPTYFFENRWADYEANLQPWTSVHPYMDEKGSIEFKQPAQKKTLENASRESRKQLRKQKRKPLIPAHSPLPSKKQKIISTPSYVSSLEVSKVRTNRELDDMYKQTIDCGYESQFEKVSKLRIGPGRR
jgi:hypothetical protein